MFVFLHANLKKKLKRLPPGIKEQFFERLELFKNRPYDVVLNNHSVTKAFPGCRSINITGNYRAIYYEENGSILFARIGTHAELYR